MDTKEFINLLKCSGNNYEPHSYSGRMMYGKKCVATTTGDSMVEVIANVVQEGINSGTETSELCEVIRNTCKDNMGYESVIYWPMFEWENDDDESEEEDA